MGQVWLIRAGRDDKYEQIAVEHGLVALGWTRVGDLSEHRNAASINALVDVGYPEVSVRSRQTYGVQLFAFRCRVRSGDTVVLLRSNAPDVAIGTVAGDYQFRPDLPAHHVRPVQWERTDVRRTELDTDLLRAPALTSIYKVGRPKAESRLRALLRPDAAPVIASAPVEATQSVATSASPTASASALDALRRNLDYALSLATAGLHLQQLKVESFEVSDVYRAAWVQAISALDHWVHQEIHERMVIMAESSERTAQFKKFPLPLELVDKVVSKEITLRQAVDQHCRQAFGANTFQQPDKIRAALANIADVSQLWPRVAHVLTEGAVGVEAYTSDQVQQRLRELVIRRNKIAHEYDEDSDNPPAKRAIDAASTTQAIEWIGRLAEAIVVVLDHK